MNRTSSGLWVANRTDFTERRKTVRTVTLPNGKRCKVSVDDSGTVMHTETDDGIDAVVRPKTVRIKIRSVT